MFQLKHSANEDRHSPWNISLFLFGVGLFCILPAVLSFSSGASDASFFELLLYRSSIFFVLVGALSFIRSSSRPILRTVLSAMLTAYFLLLYLGLAYQSYMGTPFDPQYALDSIHEAGSTTLVAIGNLMAVGIVVAGIVLSILFFISWMNIQRSVRTWSLTLRCVVVLLAALLFLVAFRTLTPIQLDSIEVVHSFTSTDPRNAVETFFSEKKGYTTSSHDNLFILQQESGDAPAVEGLLTVGGKKYDANFMPRLSAIVKDGVFLPQFWGNSVQTNRGQEIILCGVMGNVHKSFSIAPKTLQTTCLPEILRDAGYKTIVFRADRLGYSNEGNFFSHIGFTEVHYKDTMQPGDPTTSWGYDDCIFFQRAFEYLKKHYPDPSKLFVYFEATNNHFPFSFPKRYSSLMTFVPPSSLVQRYLDSYTAQDHCVQTFYDNYKTYSGDHSHLFILPDHSWPVGLHTLAEGQYATIENFLTYLAYFPPLAEKNAFRIGQQVMMRFSQEELIPTIFDLLNVKHYTNSFAPALRAGSGSVQPTDDCKLLVQPYINAGQIVIIKNQHDFYQYSLKEHTVTYYNLQTDFEQWHPKVIARNVSYALFKTNYYCSRFTQKDAPFTTGYFKGVRS